MHAAWTWQNMFFISHMYKYVCAQNIKDVKPIV